MIDPHPRAVEHIWQITDRVDTLSEKIDALSNQAETARRRRTMPGIGPITALAIETFAPPMEVFKRGRDFTAWLGLVPIQNSSGGKQRLFARSPFGARRSRNDERHHRLNCGQRRIHAPTPPNWRQPAKPWLN
jgi:transposase